jgi:hypothetical protein
LIGDDNIPEEFGGPTRGGHRKATEGDPRDAVAQGSGQAEKPAHGPPSASNGHTSESVALENGVLSDYADVLEAEINGATTAPLTARVINGAHGTDEWRALAKADPGRARELNATATARIAALKGEGATA